MCHIINLVVNEKFEGEAIAEETKEQSRRRRLSGEIKLKKSKYFLKKFHRLKIIHFLIFFILLRFKRTNKITKFTAFKKNQRNCNNYPHITPKGTQILKTFGITLSTKLYHYLIRRDGEFIQNDGQRFRTEECSENRVDKLDKAEWLKLQNLHKCLADLLSSFLQGENYSTIWMMLANTINFLILWMI